MDITNNTLMNMKVVVYRRREAARGSRVCALTATDVDLELLKTKRRGRTGQSENGPFQRLVPLRSQRGDNSEAGL